MDHLGMEEFVVIWKPAKITFEEVALTPVNFVIPGNVQQDHQLNK